MSPRHELGPRCWLCNNTGVVVVRGEEAAAKAREAGRQVRSSSTWPGADGLPKFVVDCTCRVPEPVTAGASEPAGEQKPFDWSKGWVS